MTNWIHATDGDNVVSCWDTCLNRGGCCVEKQHANRRVCVLIKSDQSIMCGAAVAVYTLRVCVCVCVNTHIKGTIQWHIWLRHFTTSWKFAGSIPNDVNGIFH